MYSLPPITSVHIQTPATVSFPSALRILALHLGSPIFLRDNQRLLLGISEASVSVAPKRVGTIRKQGTSTDHLCWRRGFKVEMLPVQQTPTVMLAAH